MAKRCGVLVAGCTWWVGLLACSGGDVMSKDSAAPSPAACVDGQGPGCTNALELPRLPENQARADGEWDSCVSIKKEAMPAAAPVDIVWTIDNSGSMEGEIKAVEQNLASFAASIAQLGIDLRVVVITCKEAAGCERHISVPDLGASAGRYRFIDANIASNDALKKTYVLRESYADFVRAGARLHLVGVTDDNSNLFSGAGWDAKRFKKYMEAAFGKPFTYHAIASEFVQDTYEHRCEGSNRKAERYGKDYYELAAMTGGKTFSICSADWSALLGELRDAVDGDAQLPCTYNVPEPPTHYLVDAAKARVTLGRDSSAPAALEQRDTKDACAGGEGWYFSDESHRTLELCPATCGAVGASAGSSIAIDFGCEGIVG